MAQLPCYHVTTAHGETYGVAATSVRDALQMTQERLTGEYTGDKLTGDKPLAAKRVASWEAEYGTVLHY